MDAGWDGEWYLRAYDHYKHKIGSKECEDGKIFIEPQGFCVIAEIGLEEGLLLKGNGICRKISGHKIRYRAVTAALYTDIMWNSVRFLLIHQDTKKMQVSSVTTTHGSLSQKP